MKMTQYTQPKTYYSENESLPSYILKTERAIVSEALEKNCSNKSDTAKELGMTFRQLSHKLKELELE
jgi:two-component system response regulator PilR (NtrC family)